MAETRELRTRTSLIFGVPFIYPSIIMGRLLWVKSFWCHSVNSRQERGFFDSQKSHLCVDNFHNILAYREIGCNMAVLLLSGLPVLQQHATQNHWIWHCFTVKQLEFNSPTLSFKVSVFSSTKICYIMPWSKKNCVVPLIKERPQH